MARVLRSVLTLPVLLAATAATPLAGSGAPPRPHGPAPAARDRLRLAHAPEDAEAAAVVHAMAALGVRRVEAFFGSPFPREILVEILPDRDAFTASFPPEWGLDDTQCWMVATGVADRLRMLSPRAWRTQACEHDPDDEAHLRGIVWHELVHVYHGQRNPTGDFTGAEEIGWFAEGLAVHVSGQLREGHLASPREAIETGAVPHQLEDAWSGKYRYGTCGTLVAYLDATLGREAIVGLLSATSEAEILAAAGMTEAELLAGWAEFVRTSPE